MEDGSLPPKPTPFKGKGRVGEEIGTSFDELRMFFGEIRASFDKLRVSFDELRMSFGRLWTSFGELGASFDMLRISFEGSWGFFSSVGTGGFFSMRTAVRMGMEVEGGEKNLQKTSAKMTRMARPIPMMIHRFPKPFKLFLSPGCGYVGVPFDSFNRSF